MRLLQITIPSGKRKSVVRTLDHREFDYFISDETGNKSYDGIAYVPLPTEAVSVVLDDLHQNGLTRDDHIIIINAETDVSRKFEKHEGKFRQESSGHISIDDTQLRTKAKDMLADFRTYLLLTVISAVVATAGLLLGSPAVVVGSMVIAPLIGPTLGAAAGTVLDDTTLFRRSVKRQGIGIFAAVSSAAVFAWCVKIAFLVPPTTDVTTIGQVSGRLTPDFLSLIIALGAGIAGVLSIATGSSVALVGVMIAAALIPPAAIVGIGIAWGLPPVVISSSVLVLVNVLSVNLAALAVFWYLGYRPQSTLKHGLSRMNTLKRGGTLAVTILLLSLFLLGVTHASIQHARVQGVVQDEVENVLDAPSYDDIGLVNVKVTQEREGLFRKPDMVIITVTRPQGKQYPGLAESIRQNINARTAQNASIQIRFIPIAGDVPSFDRSEHRPFSSVTATTDDVLPTLTVTDDLPITGSLRSQIPRSN